MTRGVAAHWDLTPARFDLLYAIFLRPEKSMTQAAVRHALGVSAATVSRMVKSLEELGFVKRWRQGLFVRDRRTRLITLTDEGQWRVRGIHESVVMDETLDMGFESVFGFGLDGSQRTIDALFKSVAYMAKHLKDRAFHLHPGEPPIPTLAPWLELSPERAGVTAWRQPSRAMRRMSLMIQSSGTSSRVAGTSARS